jgi:hypothetical protein
VSANLLSTAVPRAVAPPTDELAQRIRAAVRAEAYEHVMELLGEHKRRLERHLAAAAGDAEETRRVAAEARDLLEWAKATVLANRAHMAVSLGRVHQAAAYRSRGAASSSTWRLEG